MARAPFQVLVYPYRFRPDGEPEYALFRRSDSGFWQGVAGGGEDDETPAEAALREAGEEAGIPDDGPLLRLDTTFSVPASEFRDSYLWGDDVYVVPVHCFGLRVEAPDLILSREHTEYRWLTYAEAAALLHFDGDRTAVWELDRRVRGPGLEPAGRRHCEPPNRDTLARRRSNAHSHLASPRPPRDPRTAVPLLRLLR